MADLIELLQEANIIGRGGAEFPAHRKWRAVRDAPGTPKYVICNVSEREPGVFKDYHILARHPEKVIAGMTLAMKTVGAAEGIINLNVDYEKKFKKALDKLLAKAKEDGFTLRLFEEAPGYIGGEESALLNAMEGKRCEPRLKPPFPTDAGLRGKPTLIHNVETLYDIACVADGSYDNRRFYSVSGAVPNIGVYRLPCVLTVRDVLTETQNLPAAPYFVQAGGGAGGVVLNADQAATERVRGTGAIIVHLTNEDPRALLLDWLRFFQRESCGKCTPCREGTYQLLRMVEDNDEIPWDRMQPILDVLERTSFCALGRSVPVPVLTYYKNVYSKR
ncbi:MAG: NADH-ubiquinone oxidoreductase-F iron-sulfur binding region domain-containing protein [Candidatus Peribacteraceae bacterium]|nr:NADH-ubiquinone oxidoreductase-F iron-sulfur binding region domain-containing protein [Candidatus Peribacteraceae bacterium]